MTTRFSSAVSASSRAATSACSDAGRPDRVEVELGRRRPGTYGRPAGTTRSRSIRARTVSTANSGMPSARATRAARAAAGRPTTSPSTSVAMAASSSGSEADDAWSRRPPSVGRRASSSGRARASTKIGARAGAEQVVEEVQQPVVGVLRVVDHQHHGRSSSAPSCSRKAVHAANRSSRANAAPPPAPSEDREPRAQPLPLAGVGDELRARPGVQPLGRRRRRCRPRRARTGRAPPRPAPRTPPRRRRSRQRPRCQRVGGRQPVDVLLELPGQPGLADPGLAVEDHQPGPTRLLGRVEQVLDQPQVGVATGERRLEPVDPLHRRRPRRPRRRPATAGTGSALPLSACSPVSSNVIAAAVSDRVVVVDPDPARARRPTGPGPRCSPRPRRPSPPRWRPR